MSPTDLRVKIFADGADLESIARLAEDPIIAGFTTNPTLMRAAGVTDYEGFSRSVLELIGTRPISFEVFSDNFDEMRAQARHIASWGPNVFVKVPVTDTAGRSTEEVQRDLVADGVQLNVTAVMTLTQVARIVDCLAGGPPSFLSVFAGRIADAGVDPIPTMVASVAAIADHPEIELIWASPREVLNIVQANDIGCQVITVTPDLLKKLGSVGRDLDEFSLDTVRMFHRDAQSAGYQLDLAAGADR